MDWNQQASSVFAIDVLISEYFINWTWKGGLELRVGFSWIQREGLMIIYIFWTLTMVWKW